jgi:nucleoside-diphosphate-sugar epimerase
MKILVVGGAGYIGSVLVPKLMDRGYNVEVADLLWFGNYLPRSVRVSQKDLFDSDVSDLKGYDQLIFLAGLSNDPMAEYSPALNFIENGSFPSYLAYMAKKAGIKRYIYAGSCSVYGYTINELYDENSPAVCDYPYGISKLQGEFGARQVRSKGMSVICLRQGTVSGFSPRMRFDLIVNTMFKTALTERVITVNNPAIWRPILAIQDAVAAYVRAIEAPEEIGGIFNIASGNYTVGEVADYVQAGVKKHLDIEAKIQIKHIKDFRNYKVSIEKAKNVLSFKPGYELKDIVEDLANNIDRFKDLDDEKYYNIRIFKKIMADKSAPQNTKEEQKSLNYRHL